MNRLGLLPPSSLEDEQTDVYIDFSKETQTRTLNYVHSKDEDGSLLGPAGALIHNPEVLHHVSGLQRALSKSFSESRLPRYVQEVASLVVGSRTQAAYEIYAHAKSSGFRQDYLDDIRSGCCPPELDDKGRIAFKVATELGQPGSLPESTWQNAVDILGLDGASALIQCVGFYTFLSTISNGFDVQLPEAYVSSVSSPSSARSSVGSDLSI